MKIIEIEMNRKRLVECFEDTFLNDRIYRLFLYCLISLALFFLLVLLAYINITKYVYIDCIRSVRMLTPENIWGIIYLILAAADIILFIRIIYVSIVRWNYLKKAYLEKMQIIIDKDTIKGKNHTINKANINFIGRIGNFLFFSDHKDMPPNQIFMIPCFPEVKSEIESALIEYGYPEILYFKNIRRLSMYQKENLKKS